MTDAHLTAEHIARLRDGALGADEIRMTVRHIGGCERCAKLAAESSAHDLARLEVVLATDDAEPPEHLAPDERFGWVDGVLDAVTRGRVETHLEECELCREDVADLQRLRVPSARRRWPWLAAAAAIAAGVTAMFIRLPMQHDAPPPPTTPAPRAIPRPPAAASQPGASPRIPMKPEWEKLVADALSSGRLPYPAELARLRGRSEVMRGGAEPAATRSMKPAGVVIDATMPEFSWPAVEGASYGVSIFRGGDEVTRGESSTPRWQPSRALERGAVYTWQVEVAAGGRTFILPAPSDPPATFRILSAAERAEIEAARQRHPEDDLLLAVLYARAGMEREAKQHLLELDGSTDPRVARLVERFGR